MIKDAGILSMVEKVQNYREKWLQHIEKTEDTEFLKHFQIETTRETKYWHIKEAEIAYRPIL